MKDQHMKSIIETWVCMMENTPGDTDGQWDKGGKTRPVQWCDREY